MKEHKIAPDIDEISVAGKTISVDFNDCHIEYECEDEWGGEWEHTLKQCLQMAIAFSSKPHQLVAAMKRCNVPGKLTMTTLTPAT